MPTIAVDMYDLVVGLAIRTNLLSNKSVAYSKLMMILAHCIHHFFPAIVFFTVQMVLVFLSEENIFLSIDNFVYQKGNIPLAYIAAHLSKIHGLDWSPEKESNFVTASNDNTVKVAINILGVL